MIVNADGDPVSTTFSVQALDISALLGLGLQEGMVGMMREGGKMAICAKPANGTSMCGSMCDIVKQFSPYWDTNSSKGCADFRRRLT